MRLLQIAQHAEDLERATAWYQKVLGAPPAATYDPPGLVFFHLGRTRLLLDRAASSALIYLEVPDVKESVRTLRADGVTIDTEPHVIFNHADDTLGPAGTAEWMAFVIDSEGNQVGLVSQLPE
ncbi:methylmalonyl-CoA epimerase [Microlunatus sp. Gsoil 973]|jgi:methylmalonyl-CoA/ethylmalonyl-CoA epimerase|nr:methylmalonyl-CoA epimerase [Microlunatus sp. Gsoil 973]